ncbi:unnamed protein product [Vicia faba]|uniref:Uncharacterized protein n=1 Tax=Vicia faba TaxID=3906 RepID=A0AAV0YM43_VICFA|nr:unnamed protein product [Vicia faba]
MSNSSLDYEQQIYGKLPNDISDRHVLLWDPILGTGTVYQSPILYFLNPFLPGTSRTLSGKFVSVSIEEVETLLLCHKAHLEHFCKQTVATAAVTVSSTASNPYFGSVT